MGLEFETAALAIAEDEVDEGKIMKLDGVELRYYYPGEGQVALVMAMTEERKKNQQKIAGLIDFFFSVFDQESQQHLQKRLWDRTDSFDIGSPGGINDIVDGLLEEWSGRPTKPSSGSMGSRDNTGPSSSPAIQGSISSDSPSTPS